MKKIWLWLGEVFTKIMYAPGVNSRLIFLAHSMVSVIGVLILTVAFVCVKDKTGYEGMVLALSGNGGAAAIGRYFTKKGDQGADPAPDPKGEGA
jgi:hypothetical protein